MSDDSIRSWNLALASMRELCIRRKQIQPREDNPDEIRWAREGDVPVSQLETVKR